LFCFVQINKTTNRKGYQATSRMVVGKKTNSKKENLLFQPRKKNFRIGGDIRPKADLGRFVKWPSYIRIQRQRKILYQRLKVPPSIKQFQHTLNKNQATELFKLFTKYRPETKVAKKERLEALATSKKEGKDVASPITPVLKFGLKHITDLICDKKVSLVAIAHDVNPIELVIWLPALCRKNGIPFCIVKGKARLGTLVGMKNAAVVALPENYKKEDEKLVSTLKGNFTEEFNNRRDRTWGGGIMGKKTVEKLRLRAEALAREEAKKNKI